MRLSVAVLALAVLVDATSSASSAEIGELPRIFQSDPALGSGFGTALAVSGNTAVIGSKGDATLGASAGAVYVYKLEKGSWRRQQKLLASDGQPGSGFGSSVAIDGSTIVVAAPGPGTETQRMGSVYVWTELNETWIEQAKLVSSDLAAGDNFGFSVDISEDLKTVIVGAYGDQDAGTQTGSAYVFERQGSDWIQTQKLLASDLTSFDGFGSVVRVMRQTAAICAPGATSVHGQLGVVYIYERNSEQAWIEQQKVATADSSVGGFCRAMDFDGETLIVGAPDAESAAGVYGGKAYTFVRSAGGTWTEANSLTDEGLQAGDHFGWSVSVDGRYALVGAESESTDFPFSGAVYAYEGAAETLWTKIGKVSGNENEVYGLWTALDRQLFIVNATPGNEVGRVATYRLITAPQLQQQFDVDGNEVPELGVSRPAARVIETRDGASGLLLRQLSYLTADFEYISGIGLPDVDGNGFAESAALATRISDGRTVVEIRNIGGAELARQLWFSAGHTALAVPGVVGDADGNGVPEVAVLSIRDSDGRGLVEVKNAYGPTNPQSIWVGAGLTPLDLAIVPDSDGNGVPEVAILSTRNSDGRIVVEVKNAAGPTNPSAVWFMAGNTAIDLAVVADKDGNGIPEVAVLSKRNSDGRLVTEVKNARGPTNPSAVWFAAGHTGLALKALGDADGNAAPEIAVLSRRDSDGRILVEVKNATGPTNPRSLWYPPGYAPLDLAILDDVDGNGIQEAGVLMRRDGDGRLAVESRNAAGPQSPKDYWFSP